MFIPLFDPKRKVPSILSYYTMRKAVGILGISLPIVIFAWTFLFCACHALLDSISTYYHTDMRDIFVGILCAVALFLFSYHGYGLLDFIIFKLTGLAGIGVAFFPVFIKDGTYDCLNPTPNQSWFSNIMHYSSAGLFFVLLAFISIVLFRKSHPDADKSDFPRDKKNRNRVYLVCGIIIMACVLLLAVCNLLPADSPIRSVNPVFWIETIALFSFGISWLVKGQIRKSKKIALGSKR